MAWKPEQLNSGLYEICSASATQLLIALKGEWYQAANIPNLIDRRDGLLRSYREFLSQFGPSAAFFTKASDAQDNPNADLLNPTPSGNASPSTPLVQPPTTPHPPSAARNQPPRPGWPSRHPPWHRRLNGRQAGWWPRPGTADFRGPCPIRRCGWLGPSMGGDPKLSPDGRIHAATPRRVSASASVPATERELRGW